MKLNPGQLPEYRKRHDEIWPELKKILQEAGVHDYSIFFDEETHALFATLKVEDEKSLDALPAQAVMKKWWTFMRDIMSTRPDHSPESVPLKEVFYLP